MDKLVQLYEFILRDKAGSVYIWAPDGGTAHKLFEASSFGKYGWCDMEKITTKYINPHNIINIKGE